MKIMVNARCDIETRANMLKDREIDGVCEMCQAYAFPRRTSKL